MNLTLPLGVPAEAGCCALIAVKARTAGKSRLADQLAPAARLDVVRAMLAGVIEAARGARSIGHVVVVSPERDQVPDAIPVLADAGCGLNAALKGARHNLARFGFRRLLILPGDLPYLRAEDVDALVGAGRVGGCALAPDRHGSGTNGLYLDDLPGFRFAFGPGSRARHEAEAQRLGRAAALLQRPGLEFDVDQPSDLWECRTLCTSLRHRA